MAWFRTSELVWALVVASVMAFINVRLAGEGTVDFRHGHFQTAGFGPARGWPFRCVAAANEEGRELAASSVLKGDWTVYPNVFKSGAGYPHAAVNWPGFLLNCLLAGVLVIVPIVHQRRRRARLQPQPEAATFPER